MLSTNTANYLELIGNGKSYRVPPFQRDYAWTEQEWEDLWQDIVALHAGEAELHYMAPWSFKRRATVISG